MNVTKLVLFTLCTPLFACDLLDVEDDPTSAEDASGDDSGGADAQSEAESGGDDPTAEDPGDEASDSGADVDSSSGGPDDPPSEVPVDLIGSWYTGDGEMHLETLDLFTDGTYQEERKGEGPLDGCYTLYTQQLSGTYTVSGDAIELEPTTSHLFVDACGTTQESDEVPAAVVFDLQLGADEWGYTLRLTPDGGVWDDSILYHRL